MTTNRKLLSLCFFLFNLFPFTLFFRKKDKEYSKQRAYLTKGKRAIGSELETHKPMAPIIQNAIANDTTLKETVDSKTETSHQRQTEALMLLWKKNLLVKGEFKKTIQEITQATATALEVERVGVWLFNVEHTKICCIDLYEATSNTHSVGGDLYAADYPYYFQALNDHLVIAAHQAKSDPRTCEFSASYLTPFGIDAMLDAPIRIPEGIAGIVCIEHIGAKLINTEYTEYTEYTDTKYSNSEQMIRERIWSVDEQVFATSIANIVAMNIQEDRQRQIEQALRESEERFLQSQKLEALGRLAGGISHDFNNFLNVIGNYSEMLLRRLDATDRSYQYAEEIKKATQRATLLTRQLLMFSRQQVSMPVVLNLNTIIAEIAPMLHHLVGEDIELILNLNPTLHSVKADLAQLEQVLMNLVVNARDAMPTGGIVTISTQNLSLCPTPARENSGKNPHEHSGKYSEEHLDIQPVDIQPGSYVVLQVNDTGMGMDAATQARIFEPFFTTKEPGKGTGLGLATVFGIVKQCNGTILVKSQLDQGTVFRIYLPQTSEIVVESTLSASTSTRLSC